MAEESQDGQEKTEEPSQRKLEKAAEDGKVLSSKEAFVFTSMFAGFMLMFITPMFLAPLLDDWGAMFHFERPNDLRTLIADRFADIIWIIVLSGLVIGLPLMVVSLATQTVIGGINFAPKALYFYILSGKLSKPSVIFSFLWQEKDFAPVSTLIPGIIPIFSKNSVKVSPDIVF